MDEDELKAILASIGVGDEKKTVRQSSAGKVRGSSTGGVRLKDGKPINLESIPYLQDAEDGFERRPYDSNKSAMLSLFYKNKPDLNDEQEQLRLRRVSQMQSLGSLIKNLGEFVGGRGYAPVEKAKENTRLYQTLAMSDAERQRIRELEDRYRNQELNLQLRDIERHEQNEDDRLKRRQALMAANHQVDAQNTAARNELNMKTGLEQYSNTDQDTSGWANSETTPVSNGAGGAYGRIRSENDGSFTYQTNNNRMYRIPANKIETLAAEMIGLGIISDEDKVRISFLAPSEKITGLRNLVIKYMPQFAQMAAIDIPGNKYSKRWNDIMHNPYYGFYLGVVPAGANAGTGTIPSNTDNGTIPSNAGTGATDGKKEVSFNDRFK
jgi:hypothetical protein